MNEINYWYKNRNLTVRRLIYIFIPRRNCWPDVTIAHNISHGTPQLVKYPNVMKSCGFT